MKKNQPLREKTTAMKKKCDNKKQKSFDIKTNPTLLGKKAKPLFSSGKILWEKKTLEKNKKKKKTTL